MGGRGPGVDHGSPFSHEVVPVFETTIGAIFEGGVTDPRPHNSSGGVLSIGHVEEGCYSTQFTGKPYACGPLRGRVCDLNPRATKIESVACDDTAVTMYRSRNLSPNNITTRTSVGSSAPPTLFLGSRVEGPGKMHIQHSTSSTQE